MYSSRHWGWVGIVGIVLTCSAARAADTCDGAVVVPVAVGPRGSPNTVTVYGDSSTASGTDCLPTLGDVGWWEAFVITETADVTIDFCGTYPLPRPLWSILYRNCVCADYILDDYHDRGTTCPDFNLALTFLGLAPGTYYYPIYMVPGDKRCGNTNATCGTDVECDAGVPCTDNLHPYQIHISAQQAQGSCCRADGCTDGVTRSDCAGGSFAVESCASRICTVNVGADDCSSTVVTSIPVGPRLEPTRVTVFGDNSTASGTDCLPDPGDLGWWDAFVITEVADVTIDFCGTYPLIRPVWANIYRNCSCGDSVPPSSSERGTTCGDFNLARTFLGLAPGTYYLPLYTVPGDKRCGDTGLGCVDNSECNSPIPCTDNLHPYQIHISAGTPLTPPGNDNCADAIDLTGAMFPVTFDTKDATDDGPEIVHTDFHPLGTPAFNDIWYKYTSPNTCALTVSLCEEPWQFDSMVSVYSGGTCPPGEELVSDDESCETCEIIDCTAGPGEVTVRALADAEYTIRVSGYGRLSEGTGVINIYCETDADGDGVVAGVDPNEASASGDFSDGTTFGVVTGSPNTFLVRDVYRPTLGVLLIVYGPGNATVQACGSAGEFIFTPAPFGPGRYVITCPPPGPTAQAAAGTGLVRLKVGQGLANAVFNFPGGVTQTIEVTAGGDATFVELPGGLEVTVGVDSLPGAVTLNGIPIPTGPPVNTTPPAITNFHGSSLLIAIGEEVDFEAVFEDNVGDTNVVTFDFGDGSPNVVVDPASSPTMRSHVYAAAGSYVVTVTVTDALGSQATEQLNVVVYISAGKVVWDPAGICTIPSAAPFTPCLTDADCVTPAIGPCKLYSNIHPEATTRSLRFRVTGTGTPTMLDAIKVTMVDLQHPNPRNSPTSPPANYTTFDTRSNGVCSGGQFNGHHCDTDADCVGTTNGTCSTLFACTAAGESNGCARWVGKPGTFYESEGPPQSGPYRAARLQCTPFYWDWKSEGLITVVGAEIVPSSEYSVQDYAASCIGAESTCTNVSAPVTMYTRRLGDVDAPYNPGSTPITNQPNAGDIAQLVNKFKNLLGAPVKARAQLQPNLPELNASINALDIVAVVDAFKGLAYGFSGPCPCPSTQTCGLPCAGCAGMCVKTCTGGANDGEPCISTAHCPGGVCSATGTCRDRCGRCTP